MIRKTQKQRIQARRSKEAGFVDLKKVCNHFNQIKNLKICNKMDYLNKIVNCSFFKIWKIKLNGFVSISLLFLLASTKQSFFLFRLLATVR